jgi:hypothetical protein
MSCSFFISLRFRARFDCFPVGDNGSNVGNHFPLPRQLIESQPPEHISILCPFLFFFNSGKMAALRYIPTPDVFTMLNGGEAMASGTLIWDLKYF